MIFVRAFGWTLVVLAIFMASAEAVMALGAGRYSGLITADIWTLLVGQSPSLNADSPGIVSAAGVGVMATPAWSVPGAIGIVVTYVCRKRRDHKRVFRTIR